MANKEIVFSRHQLTDMMFYKNVIGILNGTLII